MRTISGTYTRNKKLIPFSAEIPASWDELDKHQFATIIQVLHFRKADPFTISVSLLALLFGPKHFHILDNLPPEDLHSLVPLTNFLLEEKPMVKNHFPRLKINGREHAAPADDLSNLSFGEWCFVFECYNFYHHTNDPQCLNELIAIIYRPIDPTQKEDSASFSGDIREKFNESLIKKRSGHVAAIEERIKLAVLAWFSVALMQVTAERPNVFPRPADGSEEAATRSNDESHTWMSVFRDLLGPKWGTTEQLKHTNALFVLDELEERQIEYKKAMRKS